MLFQVDPIKTMTLEDSTKHPVASNMPEARKRYGSCISPLRIALLAALAVVLYSGCRGSDDPAQTRWDPRPETYRPPPTIVAQPAIVEPDVMRADEVDARIVGDEDLVIGVEIDGEARAYPVNQMDHTQRTVINDILADRPIAVTLSRKGFCVQVFATGENTDHAVLLKTTSRSWQGSELLVDEPDRTHWCQILGVGLYGPRKGESLPRLPYAIVDWATWRAAHPRTTVVTLTPMTHKFHNRYLTQTAGKFTVGLVQSDGAPRAWRLDQLLYQPVHQETWNGRPLLVCFHQRSGGVTVFDRRADGQTLDFDWKDGRLVDQQTGSTWHPLTGQASDGPMKGTQLRRQRLTYLRDFFWRKYFPNSDDWACPLTLFFAGQCAESVVWESLRGTPGRSALVHHALERLNQERPSPTLEETGDPRKPGGAESEANDSTNGLPAR